jgi:hypothetical protein
VIHPRELRGRWRNGWRRLASVAIPLTIVDCSRVDPDFSREKAEAILRAHDFTEIELQADPNGW